MKEVKRVHANELQRIVVRLANQTPVRYYLDASRNGSFDRLGLEVYRPKERRFPSELSKDLLQRGFRLKAQGAAGDMLYDYWEAERSYDKETQEK